MSREPLKPPPSLQPPALGNPPREVPMLVCWANLFGGFSGVFGCFWTGFTLAFFWFFVPLADVAGLWEFRGELATAQGKVVASEQMRLSVNKRTVYKATYRFEADDGAGYQGTAYSFGTQLDRGATVAVEYRPDNPAISRAKDYGRSPIGFSGWSVVLVPAFLLVFLSVGVGFLAAAVRQGLRANRLLANGRLAVAKLKSKEPTNTRINNQTVWKFTFEFAGEDGQKHEMTVRTHKTEDLSNPEGEYLLYDPARPAVAVMLDSLPSGVETNEEGRLRAADPSRAVRALLAPAVVITVHAVIAYFVLLY